MKTKTELEKMMNRFKFLTKAYAEFGAELCRLEQLTEWEEIKEQFEVLQTKWEELKQMLIKWINGEKLKGYEDL